jgi:transcription initiation factor IIE alpha subunit
MVGIIITDDELSKVLHINKANVKKSIVNLMEKEVIGIVLLDNNQYAYHFVL